MIIEWVGCSGTGKTTLREEVYKNLTRSGVDVRRPLEIFLGRTIAKSVTSESIRNIVLDVLIIPWAIFSAAKYRLFFKFCLAILNNGYFSVGRKFTLLRSIFRKMGLYVFLKKFCDKGRPILFDEGTVHIAQFLFANENKKDFSEEEIKRFCELVPTPDLIIQIMASESEVLERTFKRKHLPSINTSPESLKQFIIEAQKVFKSLHELNPWPTKTIFFFNPNTPSTMDSNATLILTNQILDNFPSLKK